MGARAGLNRLPFSNGAKPGTRLVDRVVDELSGWPGLRVSAAECGTGSALALGGRQIVHLPGEHEAELRLGAPTVRRLLPALHESGQLIPISADEPAVPTTSEEDGEEWVRIRMDGHADVSLILSLASLAIAAGTRTIAGPERLEPPCPRARRVALLGISRQPRTRP
ncbi:luciferase family protein [Actinomadura syzygii]|uniref:Luciferase domain-containing protein n=1 Tax=Actinomadura syzygii TaxID=1427538 RepID=A0A5D0U3W4_9ACTN|nr:luciferase family protein [Actinomadura syzygii]TYC13108.1 hypothetical protein FXF65_21610 [Actinomadura syzygii]